MKKTVLFILLALVLSPINSCKKDNEDEILETNFRLKEWIDNRMEADYKSTITYENEKIIQVDVLRKEANSSWVNFRKKTYTYLANTITQLIYSYSDESSNWEELYKGEYVFDGNKIIERATYFYDEQWVGYSKSIFEYSGDNLSTEQRFTGGSINFNLSARIDYHFEGNTIMDTIMYRLIYDEWEESYKTVFTHSNNIIADMTKYYKASPQGNWDEYFKREYDYSGNELSTIMAYNYDENLWVLQLEYSFVMNENELLEEVAISPEAHNYTFIYEEGVGNYNDIISPSNKILGIPYPLVALLLE